MASPADAQLGLSHFWQNGDVVSHGVAYVLLAMSIASWYVILKKLWQNWQLKKALHFANTEFWQASTLEAGTQAMQPHDTNGVFTGLISKAQRAASIQAASSIATAGSSEDIVTRTLRQEINQQSANMESGLTLLASVGSVSPFVGLFGTVWGIYHALINIAANGQVLIDKVAGPVGEALIMTAAGLAVAIPAVLAYNALVRSNRVLQAQIDGFAYDILGMVTAGKRVAPQGLAQ